MSNKDQEGFVDPYNQLTAEKSIPCVHSLNVIGKHNTTWIRLCNPDNHPIKLYKGSNLGWFEPLNLNTIQAHARFVRQSPN